MMAVGCLGPATAEVPRWTFEQQEIDLGPGKRLTVLTGFLLGDAVAELAVVNVGDSGDRRLRIYSLEDGSRVPAVDAALRSGVSFVDVADVGGRDRLITYESGHLNWFDPESATERGLVEVGAGYRATDKSVVPHVDITRDLNRDGRDDLVVPDVDGFWISIQRSDGSFSDAVKLGPPEPFAQNSVGHLRADEPVSDGPRTYGDVGITAATIPVYLRRVHEMDYNRDGLSDLVFWNADHFEVYTQDEQGLFGPAAETFTTDVPFDFDGVYSRAFEYVDQGMLALLFGLGKSTHRKVLHSFRDLNGDGVADLVTLTLSGPSLTKQRSLYEVHFGAPASDGTVFARDAGTAIHPRGKAGGLQSWGYASQLFEDFDGDGRIDILFRGVKFGIGGMMRALVGNSVPIDLEYYRMKDGIYPDKPTTRRRIRRFAPFAGLGNIFFPAVLMGDVNGDGRADLLVGKSPKELHVFLGVPGPDLLAWKPQRVEIDLPHDERNTRLVDLNQDGKEDLLVHHAPAGHASTETHRVTLLVAR
jgi:hypothetical protein